LVRGSTFNTRLFKLANAGMRAMLMRPLVLKLLLVFAVSGGMAEDEQVLLQVASSNSRRSKDVKEPPTPIEPIEPIPADLSAIGQTLKQKFLTLAVGEHEAITTSEVEADLARWFAFKANASLADTQKVLSAIDSNKNGKLEAAEMHTALGKDALVNEEDQTQQVESQDPVSLAQTTDNASATSKAGWGWVQLSTTLMLQMYSEPRYFKPRRLLSDVDNPYYCWLIGFGLPGADCYGYMYSNAHTDNGKLCRCLPNSARTSAGLDWSWYGSSSSNYIYYVR